MRPSQALESNRAAIRDIAARHRVRAVRVLGSVVRGTDIDGSDLDLLVEPTDQTTLLDIGKIQFELSELLGIDVDVLTPGALPKILREKVLAEAQLV
jgi:predicted nucleotidyltransferase